MVTTTQDKGFEPNYTNRLQNSWQSYLKFNWMEYENEFFL